MKNIHLTASTCHILPRFAYSVIFLIIFFEKINCAKRAKTGQIVEIGIVVYYGFTTNEELKIESVEKGIFLIK